MKDRYSNLNLVETVFFYIGLIFSLYGLLILLRIGIFSIFNYLFLLLGILIICLVLFHRKINKKQIMILKVLLIGLLLIFVFVEIKIISFSNRQYEQNADYVILLGSGVTNNGPSLDLQRRLEAAYDCLIDNDSLIIVTGGKGKNEPVSEALCAKNYLVDKGIDEGRIILEDNSFSTYENLLNSKKIIEEKGDSVKNKRILIVSSCFHLYRADYISRKLGYDDMTCKASLGVVYLWPYSYTREFFALVKEFLFFTFNK